MLVGLPAYTILLAPDAPETSRPVTKTSTRLAPLASTFALSAFNFSPSTLLAPLTWMESEELSPSSFIFEAPLVSIRRSPLFTPVSETLLAPVASMLSMSGTEIRTRSGPLDLRRSVAEIFSTSP
jgi:hypothetical protein